MILFLIQLTTIWTILLLSFYLLYRNQTYHRFNRWYILGSLLAGLIIPILPEFWFEQMLPAHNGILSIPYTLQEIIITADRAKELDRFQMVFIPMLIGYFIIVLFRAYKAIREFMVLTKMTKTREKIDRNTFMQFSDVCDQPFSFLNTIVLPKKLANDQKIMDVIVAHELTHIRSKHYYDLILLKFLDIFFPFHPCLYFFRKELLLIHEYEADQVAVRYSSEETYSGILMHFAQKPNKHSAIIHPFYYSPIKSRIMMLFKRSSRIRYFNLALVPFLFIACTYLNQEADKSKADDIINKERNENEGRISLTPINNKTDTTIANSNIANGINLVQAHFPGGEKELMEFLGKNIKYPENGRKNKIQGTTYVRFEIYEDGSIHDKVVLRSLGEEFDKEVLRVLNLMPNWIPGEQNHHKRKETYTLPIKFKLSD